MAHVKAGGRARQGTPRKGKRLGIKITGGEKIVPGKIILRQRGSTYLSGEGTKMGRDFTIYAIKEGKVNFKEQKSKKIVEVV